MFYKDFLGCKLAVVLVFEPYILPPAANLFSSLGLPAKMARLVPLLVIGLSPVKLMLIFDSPLPLLFWLSLFKRSRSLSLKVFCLP